MAIRARPPSTTPEQSIQRLAEFVGVLGVTDPRRWTAADWAADVIPHLAYGALAAAVYDRLC